MSATATLNGRKIIYVHAPIVIMENEKIVGTIKKDQWIYDDTKKPVDKLNKPISLEVKLELLEDRIKVLEDNKKQSIKEFMEQLHFYTGKEFK